MWVQRDISMLSRRSDGSQGPCAGRRREGFTLIDILVAIAVVSVLVGLMLPSLTAVRETARRVTCSSNLRQLGLGVQLYANNHSDRIPTFASSKSSMSIRGGTFDPLADVVRLRHDADDPATPDEWTGLGRLFEERILDAATVAYCPSHQGRFRYEAYEEAWREGEGELAGNFFLREDGAPRRLSDAPSRTALAVDGFTNLGEFNHENGANVLRVDSSVNWKQDLGGNLARSLMDNYTQAIHGHGGGDSDDKDSAGGPGAKQPVDPWRQLDLGEVAR
ncbi:MAG: type II secretion system protein [Planctomycetota bacterium]